MRKWVIRLSTAVAIGMVLLCMVFFVACMVATFAIDDGMQPPEPAPTISTPGRVTLASNTCCCELANVVVWLGDEVGERELLRADMLRQDEAKQVRLPGNLTGRVWVRVEFDFAYSAQGHGSYTLKLDDPLALSGPGLLLLFDENLGMGLVARRGAVEEVYLFGSG